MSIFQNENNLSDFCEVGDCSTINSSTCERLYMMDNYSMNSTDTLYDVDGCFYTHELRDTKEYQTYLKVTENITLRS